MIFIAVDIGASSGRIIQFEYANKRLVMCEVHRFKNAMTCVDSHHYWDIDYLIDNVFEGLAKCNKAASIGIDTWAVDYVCMDDMFQIGKVFAYRDRRCQDLVSTFDQKDLFLRTGLGYLPFNTIYQLEASAPLIGQFMMIPDYITYCLTGHVSCEYTNAVTTQLIDITTKDFDRELIAKTKQTDLIFQKPTQLQVWPVTSQVATRIGYDTYVSQVATHDTASAFLGSCDLRHNIVISLGTWSIVGCLVDEAITSKQALDLNFSNEAILDHKYRFQKNTMGTWMFENLRQELDDTTCYDTVIDMIYTCDYNHIIDVDHESFINPRSMKHAIDTYLIKNDIPLCKSTIEYYKLIFDSMIAKYITLIGQINAMISDKKDAINIVGGGCQNRYICERLSYSMSCKVIAGPIEATAYGNVAAQMLALKTINNYEEFQVILRNSTHIKEYKEY